MADDTEESSAYYFLLPACLTLASFRAELKGAGVRGWGWKGPG